jgi:hypothetical protein
MLPGCLSIDIMLTWLLAPRIEVGGINAFASQERTDLAKLGASIRSADHAGLIRSARTSAGPSR